MTICLKYEIKAYPTVKLFINGVASETYRGDRSVVGFSDYVKREKRAAMDGKMGNNNRKEGKLELNLFAKEEEKLKEIELGEIKSEPEESLVITLTTDNFEKNTQFGPTLVQFYRPGCSHCKALAPIWEKLASANKDRFSVAKVDCTKEKNICTKFGVNSYPTIKLFFNGKIFQYPLNGQREVQAFANFVEKVENDEHEKREL